MSKQKVWDETPTTLTEFGPLSSDVKPSGSFLTRWLRKGKGEDGDHSGSSSRTGSVPSSREGSIERRPAYGNSDRQNDISSSATDRHLTQDRTVMGIRIVDGGEAMGTETTDINLTGEFDKDDRSSLDQDNLSHSDESSDVQPGQIDDQNIQVPHRTLSSVLSRLSNILDRRSTTPQTYKDSDFKQYWMPDSSCKECYDCGDKFTTFRRRHHCRICGQIFCSKCCNQELPGKIIGYKGGIRVCDYCCKVVLRYAQQSVSTGEVKVMKDDLRNTSSMQLDSESGSFQFGLWTGVVKRPSVNKDDLSPQQQRSSSSPDMASSQTEKSAPFDLTPQSEFSSQENLLMETKILIQDSVQLRALWHQLQEAETGVEMQTHRIRLRTHQNCIMGRDLVDWLIRNDKAVKREQAVAIGQALLYAGYVESVGNQMPVFRDDLTLYKPGDNALLELQLDNQMLPSVPEERENSEPSWLRDIESSADVDNCAREYQRSSITDLEKKKDAFADSESRPVSNLDKTESNSMQEIPKSSFMSREMIEEPLPRQDSSSANLNDECLKGALFLMKTPVPSSDIVSCPRGWRAVEHLREENGEKLAYERLKQAHTEHWQLVARQLLSQQGLSASWEAVILNCVRQVSHFVRPDVKGESDDLDVRKYVHIKKIPVGPKHETSLIHGLMFTKNIAHKKMKQQISNPHILLLRGAIEYQRIENKFSSLEPQILQNSLEKLDKTQEKEFLKNCVAKIVAFHPSIVVVEKSVSRLAQEFLLDAGITLVFNVKPTVMERLARFTQADIVPSIDGLVRPPTLGFCHDFRCQTFALPNKEIKTVVVFDGCATHLGCTISLTGASYGELKRVKIILMFMIYVAYNSLLELCFAMDEFALPPPGSEELSENMEGFESSAEQSEYDKVKITQKDVISVSDAKENLDVVGLNNELSRYMVEENFVEEEEFRDNVFENDVKVDAGHINSDESSRASSTGIAMEPSEEYVSFVEVYPAIQRDDSFLNAQESCLNATSTMDRSANELERKDGICLAQDMTIETRLNTNSIDPTEIEIRRPLSAVTELTDGSDPLLSYQKNQDDSVFKRSQSIQFQEQKHTSYHQFRRTLHGTILSVSPYIKFDVPFLESETGSRCFARDFLPREIYWSTLFTGEKAPKEQWSSKIKYLDMDNGTRISVKSNIKITEAHPFIVSEMTIPAAENTTQALIADFRARGGRIHVLSGKGKLNGMSRDSSRPGKELLDETTANDPSRAGICWEKKTDCLDIRNHQRLSVLFSSYSYRSPNHPNPCVYPWVVTMDYYGKNDITLGGFLERFCFRESYTCPSPTCDIPMVDHIRRFVHGQGSINVLLKKLENPIPGAQDNILLWSWCRRCKQVTAVVPISMDTWNLSFAKYLDLRFNLTTFCRRGSAEPCPHSLHLDHYQYFGYKDIVTSFKYASLTLRELALPVLVVEMNPPQLNAESVMQVVKQTTNKGMERFSQILENTMKMKSEMTGEASSKVITEFLSEQQTERTKFRDAAIDIQQKLSTERKETLALASSVYEILDSLVLLKKMIAESVQRWNTRLQEFATNQQRKPKTSKKDKDLLSSYDDVEKPGNRLSDDRSSLLSLSITSVESVSPSCDTKQMEELRFTLSQNYSTIGQPLNMQPSLAESVKEPQTSGKTEDDSVDGWFSDLRGATRRWLSSSVFTPLALPFDPSEHHQLPPCEKVPVIVYDQEPSSIMAYALSSTDYQVKLREIQTAFWGPNKESAPSSLLQARGSKSLEAGSVTADTMLETGRKASSGVLSFLRVTGVARQPSPKLGRKTECIDSVRYTPQVDWDSLEEDPEVFSVLTGTPAPQDGDKAKSSKQVVSSHIELQFSDNSAKFFCRIYFAEQFRKVRKLIFPAGEDMFIRSLSRCKPWEAKGGKSGSTFCKTDDDRFLMKQMSSMEVESFEKFGPQYFQHVTKAFNEKRPTALAKILGVFRIAFRNTQTNTALKQDLLVMENLFYNRKISQKFDLKGSMRNRLVNTTGKQAEEELVLLDENLLKMSVDSPLYLRPHSKTVLKTAITSDSMFLSLNLVMDYSLLVGLDDSTKELVVGIIDYIRTFTWDKKLEMVVKSASLLGGQGKMPTVVSPQLYRSRFLEAMDRYFLHVPDQWSGLGRDYPTMCEDQSEEQEGDSLLNTIKR